jgi:YidC/Oxa1 family membrane protein insertase
MYSQKDEDSDWEQGESLESEGNEVEWAGTRNLFFASILVPHSKNLGTKINHTPERFSSVEKVYKNEYRRPEGPLLYDTEIDFSKNSKTLEFDVFLGPLDYSVVRDSGIKNLDDIMTMGAWILRPISKFIISSIQFIHNYASFAGYGFVLILFAFLVRLISGPLTKRSLRSTQKMQTVQPLIKEIQDKYKSDPKKMQMKIMQTYKENNVNPLSGCLLMFLQWPIMIPPFIIFRSTIELRGESFLWIKDLSQPDYLISLPFNVPLIGTNEGWTGVGILPILMGVTLYLTMKKTMANMEGQNKIMMYTMNGMFVILFNSFPAGLNLYYVVYNVLNYLQQRTTSKESKPASFFSKIKALIQKQKK